MRGDPVCLSTTDDITALLHQSIQDQLCYLLQAIYPFDRSFSETVLAQMRLVGMLCGETLCWITMGQLNSFSQDSIIQTASRFQRQWFWSLISIWSCADQWNPRTIQLYNAPWNRTEQNILMLNAEPSAKTTTAIDSIIYIAAVLSRGFASCSVSA